MSKANSDFRQGVEAAAKWLRGASIPSYDGMTAQDLAARMLTELDLDDEGTEARTVAQIVRYLRDTAIGMDDDVWCTAFNTAANDIENFDWKRS